MAISSEFAQRTREALRKGLLAVNKPYNVTSKEVLEQLKRILAKEIPGKYHPPNLRMGHGGILDHTATGVLAVGVGWGCKVLPLLLHGDKKYLATGCLGTATDTYNEVGNVTQKMKYDHINRESLEEAIRKYIGMISQVPPKYSAIKFQGIRSADLTRAGVEVKLRPRIVACHNIKCIEYTPPYFKLEISCGGGFYVRSLIHDIGQDLKSCAHVSSLHRSKHGPFSEEDMLDESLWTGPNIVNAICETMDKYRNILKRKNNWNKEKLHRTIIDTKSSDTNDLRVS